MFNFTKWKNISIPLDITSGGKRLLLSFCSSWGLIKPNKIQDKVIIEHCIFHPNIAKTNIKNGKVWFCSLPPTTENQKKSPQKAKKEYNLIHRGCLLLQSTSSKLSHRDLWNALMQLKLNKRFIRSCFPLNNLLPLYVISN